MPVGHEPAPDVDGPARAVLDANRRRGAADVPRARYDYTCPSTQTYPFQWNWDSAFHAIALSRSDPARAQAELSTLLVAKQASGFLPHMVMWQEELRAQAAAEFTVVVAASGWHTLTANPPVLPLAVERVWHAGGDDRWLDSVLRDLVDVLAWWRDRRDPDGTGLVVTFQPDESGLDMSPKYDVLLGIPDGAGRVVPRWHAAMRELFAAYAGNDGYRDPDGDLTARGRFALTDVLVNSIFGHSARALARLQRARGHDAVAAEWDRTAARTTEALLRDCWDAAGGAFYDTYLTTSGRHVSRVLTVSSLFPLILEDLPRPVAARLVAHLTDEAEFWLPYPVPSVAATEPSFDPTFATKAIFRGSSWINLNWYLHLGLRTHGFHDVADDLARRTRALVATSGLRECYGPYDAAGHGASDFSWSSLVVDFG